MNELIGKQVRILPNATMQAKKYIGQIGRISRIISSRQVGVTVGEVEFTCRWDQGYQTEIEILEKQIDKNNWAVKVTKEIHSEFRRMYNEVVDASFGVEVNTYYGKSDGRSTVANIWLIKHPAQQEITFEEFKTYIVGMKEKKIIGYKLKETAKPYETSATLIAYSDSKKSKFSENEYGAFMTNSDCYYRLQKAGLIDLWFEPIYEVDKLPKINGYEGRMEGDYIVYGTNCAKFHKNFLLSLYLQICTLNQKVSDDPEANRGIKSVRLTSDVEITLEELKEIHQFLAKSE